MTMRRGGSAFRLTLASVVLVGLGVSGPGSAQDAVGNQAGEVVAAPPPTSTSPPGAPPPGLAAAPPPEAAPTVAPSASADDNSDSDADTNEASGDNVQQDLPVVPVARPRFTTAVLQALDKVTAETLRFEAKVGEPVRYKDLVITVHDCETSAANEAPKDSIVHMDVQYQPAVLSGGTAAVRQVFRGWMFAASPGLHPFANPIYDVWVIACKTPAPTPAAPSASPPGGGASL